MGCEANQAGPNSAGGPGPVPPCLWGTAQGPCPPGSTLAMLHRGLAGQDVLCGQDMRLSTSMKGPKLGWTPPSYPPKALDDAAPNTCGTGTASASPSYGVRLPAHRTLSCRTLSPPSAQGLVFTPAGADRTRAQRSQQAVTNPNCLISGAKVPYLHDEASQELQKRPSLPRPLPPGTANVPRSTSLS